MNTVFHFLRGGSPKMITIDYIGGSGLKKAKHLLLSSDNDMICIIFFSQTEVEGRFSKAQ